MTKTQKIIFLPMFTLLFIVSFVCGFVFNFSSTEVKTFDTVSFEEFSNNALKLTQNDDDNVFDEDNTNPFKTKRLIVKSYATLNNYGATEVSEGYDGLHIYNYNTIQETENAYNYFKSLPYVEYCCPDGVVNASKTEEVSTLGLEDSFSYTTWGAASIGAEGYSKYLINTVGRANLNQVIVAVIDTGLDSDHPWFKDRIASGGKAFVSSKYLGEEYEDDNGHGTHVSGIICDLTLSNVKILPIKVLDYQGNGYNSTIMQGIQYVINLKNSGVNIVAINLSLGGPDDYYYSQKALYTDVLTKAYNAGIMPVVASGNENTNAAMVSPANVECALTVAAVGKSGNRYFSPYYSNYGNIVDISAPGDAIVSAKYGGGTVRLSGTSMAAPHVAAAVAMLCSDSSYSYTNAQIEAKLKADVIDLGTVGKDIYFGDGMVNLIGADESLPDENDIYTVTHWQQALYPTGAVYYNGKYYQIADKQIIHATIGQTTNARPNNYQGFTSLPFEQKTVFNDGSTMIDIYYDRNSYSLTIQTSTGIKKVEGEGNWLYGQEVEIKATAQEGYEFVCWECENINLVLIYANAILNMPNKDIIITAVAQPAKFKIIFAMQSIWAYVSSVDCTTMYITLTNDGYIYYTVVGYNDSCTINFKHPSYNNTEYDVIIDNVNLGKIKLYTLSNIKQDHTINIQETGAANVNSGFNGGQITGPISFGLLFVIVICVVVIALVRKKKKLSKTNNSTIIQQSTISSSAAQQEKVLPKQNETEKLNKKPLSKAKQQQLQKLEKMRDAGLINEAEYNVLKEKLLNEE